MAWSFRVGEYLERKPEIKAWETELPNVEARLALALIEKWGMVAGEADGEDTAGRQKIRLQSPEELVERACKTAQLAFARLRKEGWISVSPTFEEADKIMEERDAKKTNGAPKP